MPDLVRSNPLRRLVIFAHYDRDDSVRPYIWHYLKALRPFATEIWFVSTSRLGDADRSALADLCDRCQTKENVGLDFGMWQHALLGTSMEGWDEVLLTNSSVYAPLHPLDAFFQRIAATEGDFLGVTESSELDPHLQSYFLLFRSPVLRHPAWMRFWEGLLPYSDKRQTIRSYELGLTYWMRQHGFLSVTLFPRAILRKRLSLLREPGLLLRRRRRRGRNPVIAWPDLLLEEGCPFLKVEVLRDNPTKVPLAALRRRIEALGYPIELITSNPPNIYTVG